MDGPDEQTTAPDSLPPAGAPPAAPPHSPRAPAPPAPPTGPAGPATPPPPPPPAPAPAYAPPSWRRWIHVWLPLAAYSYRIFRQSQRAGILLLPGGSLLVLLDASLFTALAFLISILFYPARNRPAHSPEAALPWNQRSGLRTLVLSFVFDFFNSANVAWSFSLTNYAGSLAITYLLTYDEKDDCTISSALKRRLVKAAVLYALLDLVPQHVYLRTIANYISYVQFRMVFVTFAHIFITHLLHPPLGFFGRIRTLVYVTLTVAVTTALLLQTTLFQYSLEDVSNLLSELAPGSGAGPGSSSDCSQQLKDMLFVHACYSQLQLNDPRYLHKFQACYDHAGLRLGPNEISHVLSAPDVGAETAEKCTEKDLLWVWMQACIPLNTWGEDFKPFGKAYTPPNIVEDPTRIYDMLPDPNIFTTCTTQFGMWQDGKRVVMSRKEKEVINEASMRSFGVPLRLKI